MAYSVGCSNPLAQSQQMRRQHTIGAQEEAYQPNASAISEQRTSSFTVQSTREVAGQTFVRYIDKWRRPYELTSSFELLASMRSSASCCNNSTLPPPSVAGSVLTCELVTQTLPQTQSSTHARRPMLFPSEMRARDVTLSPVGKRGA